MISIIVAASDNNVIGNNGELPWRIKEDMDYFKRVTSGKTVIMGRKTYESIPPKFRPLPNRTNIIVTRQKDYDAPGCIVVKSLEEAFFKADGRFETFVIGGGEIYNESLKFANKVYLTRVHKEIEGDTFFPEMNGEWDEKSKLEVTSNPSYTFFVYERKR